MWFNFHTHTHFCDGKESVAAIAEVAIKQRLISLGYSSHAPLPFDCKWSMAPQNFSTYLTEIDQLKNSEGIEIYAGLEVDYIPDKIGPKDFPMLDYTIGSIHFVESFADGRGWEIDGPHNFFLDGLDAIFKNDVKAVIVRYFELTREMCLISCPDVVGHLDKIKIQNLNNQFYRETDGWYREEVLKTLDVIETCGAIVEVNTRGVYQKKSSTVYPSPWIIEECFKRKIPMTINSDAHHPDDLINYFPQAAAILHKAGYKHLSLLYNGKWQSLPFTEDGIEK